VKNPTRSETPARILIIAGSDSGGGAGIQADIKTVTALGGYAATALTALTAQNTRGVLGVVGVDPEFVALQIDAVLGDIGADAIKTGMLWSAPIVEAVAEACAQKARHVPLIVDPVMVAKGGAPLLEPDAREAVINRLLPRAALVTPNLPEAELLCGFAIESSDDFARAADRLLARGAAAVLIKGGHLPGKNVIDLLRTADGFERRYESPRLHTRATHGTGCTLASAIAVGVGEGLTLEHAVERARSYLLEAMRTAPGLGAGHAPLNHSHTLAKQRPKND